MPGPSPLAHIEPQLRMFLPAELYSRAWVDYSPAVLLLVYEHLRTFHRVLYDYVPRRVAASPPTPGQVRYAWQEGTLMMTDLAGFTPLMEAVASNGQTGAESLLEVLNAYFAQMIEIISNSGGDLLEFTGDALLAEFPADAPNARRDDTLRAVRAGLRMQRAMQNFARIETPRGYFSLQMRVGIHHGQFLTADIGTPHRMEHVLLGSTVQQAKQAESYGRVGRVCLTQIASQRVQKQFEFEPGNDGHLLVIDDFSTSQLGDYDLVLPTRRPASSVLLDRSSEALLGEIEKMIKAIEPLASFLPLPILNLVVQSAAHRVIPPDFPIASVMFANLVGLAEAVDECVPGEEERAVMTYSRLVALINAAIEEHGGILKKLTYHVIGSNLLICFGVPNTFADNPVHAAEAALAIRKIIQSLEPPELGGRRTALSVQIGLERGLIFAGEVGEPHGRREFNILGDPVNTAARLMDIAAPNQILVSEEIHQAIASKIDCLAMGNAFLKGKHALIPVFAVR